MMEAARRSASATKPAATYKRFFWKTSLRPSPGLLSMPECALPALQVRLRKPRAALALARRFGFPILAGSFEDHTDVSIRRRRSALSRGICCEPPSTPACHLYRDVV